MRNVLLICITLLFLVACGKFEPSVMRADTQERDRYEISNECLAHYKGIDGKKLNVAVVDFANNTLYSSEQITTGVKDDVVAMLKLMGGLNVISTSSSLDGDQLDDPEVITALAMALGADYIVTGSVDTVSVGNTCNKKNNCYYNIAADITVSLVDVKGAKTVFTKHFKSTKPTIYTARETLTDNKVVDLARSTIKEIVNLSLSDDLITGMPMQAYVVALRGMKKAALLNINQDSGIAEKMMFKPYELAVETDPVSGDTYCNETPLPFTMTASGYINDTGAWLEVNTGNREYLSKLKTGIIVRRIPPETK